MRKTEKRIVEALALLCLLACGGFVLAARLGGLADGKKPENEVAVVSAPAETPASAETPEIESTPCPHALFVNGVCADCGFVCEHDWREGVCTVCGEACRHEMHDEESLVCLRCGEKVPHRFVELGCTRCGREVELSTEAIPERYFTPCPEKGSVVQLDLRDWLSDDIGGGRSVPALLYLPYGYEQSGERVNVIVTLHGAASDEHGMMDEIYAISGNVFCYRDLYDWAIYEGRAEPFALLTFSTYALTAESLWTKGAADEMSRALREGILPGLVKSCRSYAASPELADIADARGHFGVIGVSDGSLYALWAALADNLDLFGSYTCLSANFPETTERALRTLNDPATEGYPIACFYTGAGLKDFQHDNTETRFYELLRGCSRLKENVNAFHIDVTGYHNWVTWGLELVNCLQLMFQDFPETA